MMLSKRPIGFPPAMISPISLHAINAFSAGASTPASAVWPTANQAFFVPIALPWATAVQRVWVANGATASGAWSVAVYDEKGNRLLTSGAVTQAGTNVLQFAAISPVVTLPPGQYYMAMSASVTTLTVFRHTLTAIANAEIAGMLTQATAHPLPDPATFAAIASNFLPYFGLSTVASP